MKNKMINLSLAFLLVFGAGCKKNTPVVPQPNVQVYSEEEKNLSLSFQGSTRADNVLYYKMFQGTADFLQNTNGVELSTDKLINNVWVNVKSYYQYQVKGDEASKALGDFLTAKGYKMPKQIVERTVANAETEVSEETVIKDITTIANSVKLAIETKDKINSEGK